MTEEAGREYAKKTHFYQKLIKKLHEKIQDQTTDDDGLGASSSSSKSKHKHSNETSTFNNNSGQIGRNGRSGRSGSVNANEIKGNQKLVRGLRDKVDTLETNLTQVCNELDATRRQLHRVY